jgi:ribosome-associated toxin RatA of RatAB toxin-antitoxin module
MASASHAERISATCADCFAAITDFASYPQWQTAVKSVEVHSRDPEGRGHEVEFVIDLKLRQVRYTLIYSYTEPTEVRWRYARGDVKDVTGSYSFRETATPGLIEAQYVLEVDFGFPVPAPIRNRLQREVMRRSVRELKTRVEAAG